MTTIWLLMSNSSKTTLQSSARFSHDGQRVRAAKAETGRSYAVGLCYFFFGDRLQHRRDLLKMVEPLFIWLLGVPSLWVPRSWTIRRNNSRLWNWTYRPCPRCRATFVSDEQ